MTQQSGQGAASSEPQQPAARHAHEGIVLPADGSEPLMPGTTGDHAAPPVGSPWGDPWGPQPTAPAPGAGAAWGTPQQEPAGAYQDSAGPYQDSAGPYQTPADPYQDPAGAQPQPRAAMPLPPEGTPLPPAAPPSAPAAPSYPDAAAHGGQGHDQTYGQGVGQTYGQGVGGQTYGRGVDPTYGQGPGQMPGQVAAPAPGQQPGHISGHGSIPAEGHLPQPSAGPQPQPAPQPPHQGAHAAPGQELPDASYGGHGAHGGHGKHGRHGDYSDHGAHGGAHAAAYDTSYGGNDASYGDSDASYGGNGPSYGGNPSAPLPPAAESTPQPPAGPDAEATQFIAPVGPGTPAAPGALPPERPADGATQFLGRAQDVVAGGAPDDNAPTQFIAPVTDGGGPAGPHAAASPAPPAYGVRPGAPGDRQPPAEFDSLFRREPEGDQGPASTQQMPHVQVPAPGGPVPAPEPGAGRQRRGRGGSKMPLLAVVGVGIVALGVGAGAMLSGGGGGGDDDEKDDNKPLAATAPAESDKPSPSADPGEKQAVALDKLLADSNNSRETVIGAVRDVGKCTNLKKAATDLRAAAKQREGLVRRLSGLTVDELPKNAQLTTALNKAWKASASADNHYAAWADQVAGKKGCRKGHARQTNHSAAGNRASGEATRAKQTAATLWNAIAEQHGLTKRNRTQL